MLLLLSPFLATSLNIDVVALRICLAAADAAAAPGPGPNSMFGEYIKSQNSS